jgi:prepilin-type N-terminal cleavage/methylation domain-containing protein
MLINLFKINMEYKMKKSSLTNNKGFSLIELSIVLIIIGLLVAGITGGASLIKSAELRSIMTEARGYKMAVNAYYTSQDTLPGDDDSTTMGTSGLEGDNDGKIEGNTGTGAVPEGIEAWNDMRDTDVGILDISELDLTTTTPTASVIPILSLTGENTLVPSKYKGAGWTADYATTPASDAGTATVNSNVVVFTGENGATSTTATEVIPGGTLSGLDAYSIDKKMDDGVFTTGTVFGINGDDSDGATQTTKCDEDETTVDVCALMFKIDI